MTLSESYKNILKKELQTELNLKNVHMVPDIEKIVVNMSFGAFKENKDFIEEAKSDLSSICGQKPIDRYSRKAISNFKLRAGELIALSVTMRGEKAWSFLEKLIKIVLPSVRDFRGLSKKSFDKKGNYSFGIKEHFVFPEINPDKIKHIKGMEITIKTTTKEDKLAKAMFEKLGFPLKK
ncbi:50S ribosomal protein L5 [Patescibacteria group bacterium]|nr:50S ribosomal protein L5 [Patescibacteria group bacterium]